MLFSLDLITYDHGFGIRQKAVDIALGNYKAIVIFNGGPAVAVDVGIETAVVFRLGDRHIIDLEVLGFVGQSILVVKEAVRTDAVSVLDPEEAVAYFEPLCAAVHGYASLIANNGMDYDPAAIKRSLKSLAEAIIGKDEE